MPKSDVNITKRPAHEVILDQIEKTLRGRGQWRETEVRALVRVLGDMFIPAEALPKVTKRLEKIGRTTLRHINHQAVIGALKKDYRELIR
ncbi:MAG: hypothetical protein AAB402_03870 [Patescibacteria group bacterium]